MMQAETDSQTARRLAAEHAKRHRVELAEALYLRTPAAVAARHATWRELRHTHSWSLPRIARVFGCDHTTVLAALRKHLKDGCPACGEKFDRYTDAPLTYVAGVATSRAYHHAGAMCIVQTAWVNRGEESP
jgi:hypothetical protein